VAFIGLISYSLYLWHWPILVFCKYSLLGAPTSPQRLTILVASFVLATMSWRWVETPFRRRVLFQGRIEIVSFAAISAVALVAIGLVVAHLKGIPSRFSGRELAYANGSLDKGIRTEVDLEAAESGRFVNLGESDGRSAPSIFVWGDSHAMALLSVFDTLCHEHKVFGLAATHSATAPLLDFETPRAFSLGSESVPYNDAVMEYIQKTKIHNVVLAAMWASYGSNIDHFRDCLKTTVDRLKGAGVRIWIVRQVPRPGVNVPSVLTVLSRLGEDGGDGPAWSTALYHQDRATEDRMFQGAASTGVTILDPSPFFIDAQGGLVVVDEGKPLYFDDHHISTVGAERLRNLLDPIFDAASEGH
jgi:hypothetical protein